jgi:hypothetical protein
MATIEIEVNDADGTITKVPEPVQKLIDKAFGQGQAKATDEAAAKLKTEIEKLKKGGLDPAERERLRDLETQHSRLSEELALRDKKFDEAQKIRDERHQKELGERDGKLTAAQQEIEKRTTRLQVAAVKDALIVAAAEGARKESLPELEILLGSRIGLDDALQPFVRDAKDAGKPALDEKGQPVTIEGFVKQYLADHPHHKAAVSGRGGGGRGGRETAQQGGVASGEKAAALAELERRPSARTVADALKHVGRSA